MVIHVYRGLLWILVSITLFAGAATGCAPSSSGSFSTHVAATSTSTASGTVPIKSLTSSTLASNVGYDGCNAVNYYQLPGQSTLFLGRHLLNTSSDPCSGTSWYLSLNGMDWSTRTISEIGSILVPPVTIMNGAAKITSAYDGTVIQVGQEYWVAFECADATSVNSCAAPLLSNYQVDTTRMSIVVSGLTSNGTTYSASVPKLLSYQGHLYLYWSMVTINSSGTFQSVTTRGTEVSINTAGNGMMFAVGQSQPIATNGPQTVEVFGLNPNDPRSDTAADSFQAFSMGDFIYLTTAQGGGGCNGQQDFNSGCYRLGISKTQSPLGVDTFNPNVINQAELPLGAVGYSHFTQMPDGTYDLLANISPNADTQSSGLYFISLPLDGFLLDSVYVTESVPSAMTPGQSYPASVTMMNAGPLPWTQAESIRLGSQSLQDNTNWGMSRVMMSSGQTVLPGAQTTFNFNVTAPAVVNNYVFQWQVLQEGVTWFGQLSTAITVMDGASAPLSASTFPMGTTFSENVPATIGSPSVGLSLVMQGDGNLVLYQSGTALWDSGTSGQNCGNSQCFAVFQGDGNFVIYNAGTAIWATGTTGVNASSLTIGAGSPFVTISSASGAALWKGTQPPALSVSASTNFSTFPMGTIFSENVPVTIGSPSLGLSFVMQGDGNLVLYQSGTALWDSGTSGQNCGNNQCFAVFQGDGNFVIYNTGIAIWATGTTGVNASSLTIGAGSPFVTISSAGGATLWNGTQPPGLR